MTINADTLINLFLNPSQVAQCSSNELSDLVTIWRSQKILARMCYRIIEAGVFEHLDAKTQRHLLNAKQIADRQKEQVFTEAAELARILSQSVGYLIFLKGAAYSMCAGKLGRGRIYSDIDVLVPKADIDTCEQRLAVAGWIGQEINDYDDKYYRKWAHEIPPMAHGHRGTIIDVHHNIVPVISKSFNDLHILLENTEEIMPDIHVLSAPAQLVHAAIHLFRNEEYQGAFRDITDIYLMLEGQDEQFWLDAFSLAKRIDFLTELQLAVRYCERFFKLKPPAKINLEFAPEHNQAFNDFIFNSVLLPQHSLMTGSHTPLKHFLAMMRGHIVKMPVHILLYHIIVKSYRSVAQSIFGQHVFTPKDPHPPLAGQNKEHLK
ncbi:nucleotidyltransferase family protein [Glaciecola siphonariae]|uniref:Nucleotidyltransferase family protein n=1 Tax=Glaciecola siphonariae TaxID=521012 RepID=A0ABV9LVY6_9ALTE